MTTVAGLQPCEPVFAAGAAGGTSRWEEPSHALVRAYEALIEISTQIHAGELDAPAVLALVVERARDLLGTDVAWLALVDAERARVNVRVAAGATTREFVHMHVALGTGIGGIALREGRTVVVGDQALYGNGMPAGVHRALKAEGVVSVMCAPMLHDGGMVGALYVGSRHATAFSDTSIALLTALAGQAAVAIVHSRLIGALADKNRTLERSSALHRRLSEASLSGAGAEAIAAELARLIERDVVVERGSGSGAAPEAVYHSVPIVSGGERLGALHALGGGELSELERNALDHAATVIALRMLRERAALEVEWRLRGELLEEILQAAGEFSEGLVLRGERLGVALDRERHVAVLEPRGDHGPARLLELARVALGGETLMCRRGDRLLVALDERATERLDGLLARAQRAGIAVVVGLSSRRREAAAALREAEAALRLARQTGGLVGHEELGPLRFLLDAPDTAEMAALVRDTLGPLADYDARRGGALLETLRAYLEAGGHHATTARSCHIHPSTLKYRLGRIATVLGRSPADARVRFELGLGLAVHDLLAGRGLDVLAHPPRG